MRRIRIALLACLASPAIAGCHDPETTVNTDVGRITIKLGTPEEPTTTAEAGLTFVSAGPTMVIRNAGTQTRHVSGPAVGDGASEYVFRPGDRMERFTPRP